MGSKSGGFIKVPAIDALKSNEEAVSGVAEMLNRGEIDREALEQMSTAIGEIFGVFYGYERHECTGKSERYLAYKTNPWGLYAVVYGLMNIDYVRQATPEMRYTGGELFDIASYLRRCAHSRTTYPGDPLHAFSAEFFSRLSARMQKEIAYQTGAKHFPGCDNMCTI